jgi:hypothetical protein
MAIDALAATRRAGALHRAGLRVELLYGPQIAFVDEPKLGRYVKPEANVHFVFG